MKLTLLIIVAALFIGCSSSKTTKKCVTGNQYEICNLEFTYTGKSCSR